jgi:hypothetical protein
VHEVLPSFADSDDEHRYTFTVWFVTHNAATLIDRRDPQYGEPPEERRTFLAKAAASHTQRVRSGGVCTAVLRAMYFPTREEQGV